MMLLGVTTDEVQGMNRRFGGAMEFRSLEGVFASADHYPSFWLKVAAVVRGIAGGHLFDNGNKRTAFELVKLFVWRNGIALRPPEHVFRRAITDIATGKMHDTHEIARALRGF